MHAIFQKNGKKKKKIKKREKKSKIFENLVKKYFEKGQAIRTIIARNKL